MIYNIESLYLKAESNGLKGAVKARDEHIDSLRQAMQLEHKHDLLPPHSPWWKFWKKSWSRHAWFSSQPSRGVPEPFQKSPDPGTLLRKIPHTPPKLNFADNSILSVGWSLLNYAVLPSVRSIQVVGDSLFLTCRRLVIESSTTHSHTIGNLTTWL